MAKKTTKKKTTKAAAKKKTTTKKSTSKKKATTKKSAKKTTKKSAAKTAKKASTKKSAKKTTKKSAKADTQSPKKKKTTKKSATKSTTAPAETVDPKNNGSPAKAEALVKPAPPPIRRVVRPTPPPIEQAVEDWTPLSDTKLRRIKSGLTRKDLNYFKQLLLEKRAEIVGDVMGMEEARSGGNGGDLSNMPLHMADIGSDNYEQEFTLGLVESERKLLVEIDRALQRIQDKTYGVCIITGNPIPKARLEIKPWAKYSIEVVREREKRGLHSF